MAEDKGGQEKTEDATPKRLRDARKKGQVAKSQDLNTVFVLVCAFLALAASGKFMVGELQGYMTMVLSAIKDPDPAFFPQAMELSKAGLFTFIKVLAPFVGATFVAAGFIAFMQTGGVFSVDPIKPEGKKLNPIEGLKNMLKARTLIELGKNIVKMVAVLLLAFIAIKKYLRPFLLSVQVPIEEGLKVGGVILLYFLIMVLIVFIFVAIIDVMLQRKEYKKNLRMTKDEVKREYKEEEGDPLIKGQRRQIHQEMAMTDVAQQVANSDVVITNPTHIAVAVKYDVKEMVAPQVMAKGQRLYAEMIRNLAEEHDIPIMRNVSLAWALIELEIGDEIPEDLYQAVAEILAFVYRLKAERERRAAGL